MVRRNYVGGELGGPTGSKAPGEFKWIRAALKRRQISAKSKCHSDINPGWLGYIRDYTTQLYTGIRIGQYENSYEPISIMEWHKGFEHCSHGSQKK